MNRGMNGAGAGGTLMPPSMKSFGSSPDLQNGAGNYSSIQRRYGIENFENGACGGETEEMFGENSPAAIDFQHHQLMMGSSAEFNAAMFYEEQQQRRHQAPAAAASLANRRHSIGERAALRPKTPPPPPPAIGHGESTGSFF